MIDLSIIIVNYNVKEFLLNLLASLEKASKNISSEIIVVDNNSTDDSILSVKQKYPSVITIENEKNVGFGIANNQGLEIANGENILLINPDTLVKEDTLETMIKFLDDNGEVGMAGCKVLNPDGTLQLACRRSFPRPWVSFTKVVGLSKMFPQSKLFAKYNLTYLDENDSNEVDAISGSFMMLKKEVYEKVGGFDQDFFMYGEDLDLCYRIQQAGYKVSIEDDTQLQKAIEIFDDYETLDKMFDYAKKQKGRKDDPLRGQRGKDMPEIAPFKANAAINYDYDSSLALRAEVVASDRWDDFDYENGEQELAGYGILNLKATKAFSTGFEIIVGVDNVFDNTYAVSNTYNDLILLNIPGNEVMLLNEPGRYVYTNIKYKF